MGNNDDVSMEDLNQQKNELLKYVLSQRKQALKSLQVSQNIVYLKCNEHPWQNLILNI